MRLKSIKLAGFKSFVDPTTLPLPKNLIAVVGPNGCGKSNVIDAVRWVMGESSAKNLRGEAMTDVIFSGSSSRKPVGQAFVELLFDNSDATIGGEYGTYAEIAVKRLVTREGQSQYFLNGVRCRRRDITGIFLGTGLGPRSYSIIQQDTISRMIEAKPEEVRVFIEEAAGISKYKERRRETENRMRHTRENLERLNDIREELGKQLERLDRQAKAAEKYKTFREKERLVKAQWLALRWQELHKNLKVQDESIQQETVSLEAHNAEITQYALQHTEQREILQSKNDTFESVQNTYYKLSSDIARLEEALQHQQTRRQQLVQDLEGVQEEQNTADTHLQQDIKQEKNLQEQVSVLEPKLETLRGIISELEADLQKEETAYAQWQENWDAFNKKASEISRQAEREQARIHNAEYQQQALFEREKKLSLENQELNLDIHRTALETIAAEKQGLDNTLQGLDQALETAREAIASQREIQKNTQHTLHESQGAYQKLKGRQASLEALQEAALGKDDAAVNAWLEKESLDRVPRLAEVIKVDEAWEPAVEAYLGVSLQALCIPSFAALKEKSLPAADLTFYTTQSFSSSSSPALGKRLSDFVQTDIEGLKALFENVYTVESLEAAYALLPELSAEHTVVTPEGLCLSRHCLQVHAKDDKTSGVIGRQNALESIGKNLTENEKALSDMESKLAETVNRLQALEEEKQSVERERSDTQQEMADCSAKEKYHTGQLEQMQKRLNAIEKELEEIQNEKGRCQEQLASAETAWKAATQAMEENDAQRDTHVAHRESSQQRVSAFREKLHSQREYAQRCQLQWQTMTTQCTALEENITRQKEVLVGIRQRFSGLQLALSNDNEPDRLQQELDAKLIQHASQEGEMHSARKQRDDAEQRLQTIEEKREKATQLAHAVEQNINDLKMSSEGSRVRAKTLEEQIIEDGQRLQEVLSDLPEEAECAAWEAELETLHQRIQRLGAINLAAIDEYKTESERKTYLDAQHEDLSEALSTLENAIEKIDKETKARFRETFDEINGHFKRLFPRLFGGGSASLELTDHDLLTTGILVVAQPPGKRNTSIHLLSGGEKAMTAVALVFSIFQLNPSPFCLLDEVDAPLDDSNVTRFCNMVKEMSIDTQFLFITHNKLTMELADTLTGVTMHEPGVSRLVSVDMDEAVSMAEA